MNIVALHSGIHCGLFDGSRPALSPAGMVWKGPDRGCTRGAAFTKWAVTEPPLPELCIELAGDEAERGAELGADGGEGGDRRD